LKNSALGLKNFFIFFTLHASIWILLIQTPILIGLVLFYRGIFLLFLSLAIVLLITNVYTIINRKTHIFAEKLMHSLTSLSVLCCFFVVFPVTTDRSVTVFILKKMESVHKISESEVNSIIVSDYVVGQNAGNRRLKEQVLSGNIKCEDECMLTSQGKLFLRFSDIVDTVFRTQDTP